MDPNHDVIMAHCDCEAFKLAQTPCTDNEAFGRLLKNYSGEWQIGRDLPPLKYCPWCGYSAPKIP